MAQALNIERRNGAARTALKARANDVMDDFAELRKDVNRLAEAASKAARAEASKQFNTVSGSIRERANETVGALRERASETAGQAVERVRAHPGAAVGISLGAGLLIGMLLARR